MPALVKKLQEFDYRQDWYLGKPSIPEPLEILDRDNLQVTLKNLLLFLLSDLIAFEIIAKADQSYILALGNIQIISYKKDYLLAHLDIKK